MHVAAVSCLAAGPRAPHPRRRRRPPTRGRVAPAERPGQKTAAPSQLHGLTVLVVEDHADSREMLRQMVEVLGGRAVVAENGREALGMLEGARPDAVLCDLLMPEMDGFAFVRHLRATSRWARMPVIAVTALGSDADYRQTWEAGFDAHLTKPIQHGEVAAVVRSVAGKRLRPPAQ